MDKINDDDWAAATTIVGLFIVYCIAGFIAGLSLGPTGGVIVAAVLISVTAFAVVATIRVAQVLRDRRVARERRR